MRILGALFVVYVLIMLVVVFLALEDSCDNEVILKLSSPTHSDNLFVFQRSCGATTGFSTQASVLPFNEPLPNNEGNIFIADTNHGASPSGIAGGPELRAKWQEKTLSLQYHKKTRVFKKVQSIRDIKIIYTEFE